MQVLDLQALARASYPLTCTRSNGLFRHFKSRAPLSPEANKANAVNKGISVTMCVTRPAITSQLRLVKRHYPDEMNRNVPTQKAFRNVLRYERIIFSTMLRLWGNLRLLAYAGAIRTKGSMPLGLISLRFGRARKRALRLS